MTLLDCLLFQVYSYQAAWVSADLAWHTRFVRLMADDVYPPIVEMRNRYIQVRSYRQSQLTRLASAMRNMF